MGSMLLSWRLLSSFCCWVRVLLMLVLVSVMVCICWSCCVVSGVCGCCVCSRLFVVMCCWCVVIGRRLRSFVVRLVCVMCWKVIMCMLMIGCVCWLRLWWFWLVYWKVVVLVKLVLVGVMMWWCW